MNSTSNRRPLLATSFSAPDIFCRPVDPAPAPLVYINGWHGIGKETVAECLTLLLGKDKSLLIDVRSVGRETATNDDSRGSASRTYIKPKYRRRHEHYPLLTPEHPRYYSFDLEDSDADSLGPLPSPAFSFSSSAFSPPASRSGSFSSDSTAATSTSPVSATPTAIKPTATAASPDLMTTNRLSEPITAVPSPSTPASHSSVSSQATATITASTTIANRFPIATSPKTAAFPFPPATNIIPTAVPTPTIPPLPVPVPTPCSAQNLTALLTAATNRRRIAVLPACAPDTPAGRAAVRTFEAAAARAGRPFVGVVLRCGDGEYRARSGTGSVTSQAGVNGQGQGMRFGGGRPRAGTVVGAAVISEGGGGYRAGGRFGGKGRVASLDGVMLASSSPSPLYPSDEMPSSTALGSGGCLPGNGCGDGEARRMGGVDDKGWCEGGEGSGNGSERRERSLSLSDSEPGLEVGVGASAGSGAGAGEGPMECWAHGHGPGLAMPTKIGLTVDVTCMPAFEAALQIVEFVKGLEAERDTELYGAGGSSATTSGGCGPEGERKSESSLQFGERDARCGLISPEQGESGEAILR
ncbi:hypothetical protein P885DRAFT_75308 [Corynascus similis CBS 632.67]